MDFKVQEQSDDEEEDRHPLSEEEQRRQSMIRKQARLLNEASVSLRRRREEQERTAELCRIQQQEELMKRAWQDYQRLKAVTMKDPEKPSLGHSKGNSQEKFVRSSFLRSLMNDMRRETETKDEMKPKAKSFKRLRVKNPRDTPNDQIEGRSPGSQRPLNLVLRELDIFDLNRISDVLEAQTKIEDVIKEISVIPYSTDFVIVKDLLDNGLIQKLLTIIAASNPKIVNRHREVLLRVINSLPIQRKHIPPGYNEILRPLVDHVLANKERVSIEERRMAAIASNLLREWANLKI